MKEVNEKALGNDPVYADADPVALPDNAFRELGKDEPYRPVMHPARDYREVTPYSVITGLILAVVFSAAAAYLGLKVGQVFEAAIPIAIIAVGLSGALKKKDPLGQNVIIQSIGACSGVIVAGAIFTLPALYILQGTYPDITVNFLEIFLSSLLGGILGILFFIPFRKYFVKDMHGKYPFPEATATTQVLVSSQAKGSGNQAKTLVIASLIGGIYDYLGATFGWWAETITSTAYRWGTALAEKTKVVVSCNTSAALLGLGYIVGLKYAFVIFAGSIFVWWIIIPLMGTYGNEALAAMSPHEIFSGSARMIGIGGIAMAGIIGIVKSWPIIQQAVGLAGRELKGNSRATKTIRWQTDISMKHVVFFICLALIAVLVFFWFGVINTFWQALVAWAVVVVIRIPVHDSGCQRNRHSGQQSRQRHDNDDSHRSFGCICRHRSQRHVGHSRLDGYRRRCLHRTLNGRRLRHRPEDRLLARHNSPQTGKLEIPRHSRFSRNCRRCHTASQSGLRFHRRECARGTSGQRHGKGNRTAHDGRRNSLDSLYGRRYFSSYSQLARSSGSCFLPGYVHSATA